MKKWYVGRSSIAGKGAFSTKTIKKGEKIDIGINYFLLIPYVTEFGSWVNHSWTPNTFVSYDQSDGVYYVRAKENIVPGTELTVDYRETPEFIEGPMDWYV